ncbi:hypothetical protein [Saccharothrix australiensis]|uniref:Uncharacterized protein n=1 Tax=Saccharothrix australiensis TaxID=2072 RepID=A0A495W6H5_9PSEU|nr:hypothetical protein [Saccharothrix australiensis]RKT56874.1 hypothetical protein C8E97_5587 [Saccharothrix australiensis]
MLFIVLLLVLAALGLLVPALTTSDTWWAWLSVGASAAAALVLCWDWWRRRRPGPVPAAAGAAAGRADREVGGAAPPGAGGEAAEPAGEDAEPGEEDTDAADALVVADLTDEVRVLDERPRYHLAACTWLAGRASLGLPVTEARQLGFTPCAVCAPDSTLAARKRSSGR